ncbi:MAG: hypothetical protein DRO98_08500 [Archaeoglobales archaeon]|nr:MAG: hypothetical protein DRO98_08500 [Archaeoglobales archaeon]
MSANFILQFESSGLMPDLEFLDVELPKQVLAGEEMLINLSVLNSGRAESDFRITLYEDGNLIKSIEDQKICGGCVNTTA